MMVNTQYLESLIKRSGLKKSFIAKELGISIQNLRLKCTNGADFRMSEAAKLFELLDVTTLEEKQKIFPGM